MKYCLFALLLTNICWGEYRVYQYFIKSKVPSSRDSNVYLETSTFDPVTFLAYHGGRESIQIDLLRTWMCPGHTGNLMDYCNSPASPNPKEKELESSTSN